MGVLSLKKITKKFGNTTAVDNVNLEVKDGEFVVVVGPSGCGKSTTLRMIAGLESITSGDLLLNEQRLNELHSSKRNMAMVFQSYALYPHMSVFENIAFGLRVRKIPKPQIMEKVLSAAKVLQLEDYLDRKPRELSGGQNQRVALGRAIVRDPEVFLMDEPLSNLDAKLRSYMRTEIKELQRRLGTTMVYVTHDQVEAMTMGDKIMLLKDGQVQQVGSPLELYNKPKNRFVGEFIGSPPMNFMEGIVVEKGNELLFNSEDYSIVLSTDNQIKLREFVGKKVLMGVRPEHIEIGDHLHKNRIQFNLINSEVLGSETLVFLHAENQKWTAKLNGQHLLQKNDYISLHLSSDYIHLFDVETEERLPDQFQVIMSQNETVPAL